jgi:ribosomal protein S18 acetylase RimI-like enzyme
VSIQIKLVRDTDDLLAICAQMQPANWAADNEMTSYQPQKLRAFLERGGLLLLAWKGERIAGAALGYELPHPDGEDALYVHELDTHPDFRRQGIATMLMQELFKIAKERGLSEVWLDADADNAAANGLYKKLGPSGADPGTTYYYSIKP